ncbi:Histidine biosynthesis bifunctional protein hisB [Saitoella coloradoensis]
MTIHLLDLGAGNIRSLVNAVESLGHKLEWIKTAEDIDNAERILFPGVGNFGHVMQALEKKGYADAVRRYIKADRPFMGICVGLQVLFEGSEESESVPGLGFIPGKAKKFDSADKPVPHIGWNSAAVRSKTNRSVYGLRPHSKYYYVHSYAVPYRESEWEGWDVATGTYGNEQFIGAVAKGNLYATQFHPEKSGVAGLRTLKAFLEGNGLSSISGEATEINENSEGGLTKRIIACLDVRANDAGDLVVTKGDQYDVREKTEGGEVRNLGKPVELAKRYYQEGADEVTFLNITSFRDTPLADTPMLEVLRKTSETVFVPLTIGGGIRDITDPDGTFHPAVEVAELYFKSGADKVSIGSDSVLAAEQYYARGKKLDGTTAIESIARAYGVQAVVVSVDPKRVYVKDPSETTHHCIQPQDKGPNGEEWAWYQCTIKGGREGRDVDVRQLVTAVEAMGAGEILLNCMDKDGTNSGFDLALVKDVKDAVRIPVIASSGAGKPEHFEEVFNQAGADAGLAAGIFHRREVPIGDVKSYLTGKGLLVRDEDGSAAV